jgi:hypothetical protein
VNSQISKFYPGLVECFLKERRKEQNLNYSLMLCIVKMVFESQVAFLQDELVI